MLVAEPKFFYASEKHATGLSYLQHGIAGKKGIIVLTGEPGVGKTLLVKTLIQNIATRVHVASFSTLDLSLTKFYRLLCEKFEIGINIETGYDINYELLTKLRIFSEECDKNNQYCIVIIDEAHNLSYNFSQQLMALSNFETNEEKLIQIVLVGGVELHDKLNLPEFANLKRRIAVSYTLLPLNAAETEGYINTRLAAAGAVQSPFTEDAIDTLYQYSRGVPRVIDSLSDLALFIGSRNMEQEVDPAVIVQAAQMLYIQEPEVSTVRQGAPVLDEDRTDTTSVRAHWLQEESVPDLPLLANFPKLLEDIDDPRQREGGIDWRIRWRLIKIGLVASVLLGLMFGIGAWQKHETETIINGQSSSSIPLTILPAPIELPEPLHMRKVIIVQEGDTLWTIMQREYHEPHPRLIALIQAANPEIADPFHIRIGQRIVLPIRSQ